MKNIYAMDEWMLFSDQIPPLIGAAWTHVSDH